MPRKVVLLLLVMAGLFVIMYSFYWKETGDLSSKHNPSMRIVKDLIKDNEIETAERDMLNEWINKMTLDEKIGQLIFTGIRDTVMTEETETLINQYHVGGIILFAHRSEEHTSELQSRGHLVCRLLLEKKSKKARTDPAWDV